MEWPRRLQSARSAKLVFTDIIGKLTRPLVETVHVSWPDRCSCTRGTQRCKHAFHLQAMLCDTIRLTCIAEAMAQMVSLASICSGVRMFTKALLDVVVGTIERNFMLEKSGFDAKLSDAPTPTSAKRLRRFDPCKASKSHD